jgi:glycosyltransferase involved in cell wall biosynthesis
MSKSNDLKISLGVLAHNEERCIGAMLQSLFRQSIFTEEGCRRLGIVQVELVCIPNGCADKTVDVVSAAFAARSFSRSTKLALRVREQPGKAAAWNAYVHELSDRRADYLVLMDADISFASDDVLELLLGELEANLTALVATDRPVKSIRLKERLSLDDRVSLSISEQSSGDNEICGQLYCARSSELRRIWMPSFLPVEDGFLAAMVHTAGFTVEGRPGAIVRMSKAIHYYDAHENIVGFLQHERRIIVGCVINAWIYTLLWEAGSGGHVGRFIEQKNSADPAWLDSLVSHEVAARGVWLVPSSFVFKRMYALKGQPVLAVLQRLPLAFIGSVLQLIACILANKTLRRPKASQFW